MRLFWIFALALLSLPAQAQPLQRLTTDENLIKTQDGKPVTLRGVSLCSLDWHHPLNLIEQVTSPKDKWNVNVLRLPVQAKEWKKVTPLQYMSTRIDPAVKLCEKHGLYCIIDWHDIAAWDDIEKTKALKDFWKQVAPRYANNKNIIYEIFNEPTTPKSKTKENWIAWRDAAQPWVDAIRKDAPHTLLLIGSPHWSQLTNFAAAAPFKGKGLAYTAHVYPNYKPQSWDKLFGDAAKTVPVVLTEWGWTNQTGGFELLHGSRESYAQPLRDYLDARPHIHWTAWSYDPLCGPAMLGQDKDMGDFVKEWLHEAD